MAARSGRLLAAVFQRVVQQVLQHLRQLVGIADHRRQIVVDPQVERDATLLQPWLEARNQARAPARRRSTGSDGG